MNKKDKLNNKVAVLRSPAMNCSADALDENAEREAPNFKRVRCCTLCIRANFIGELKYFCFKYKKNVAAFNVCDSYE